MPTYEYRCKACGQELEVVQSFSDDALTTCEACGGALRKVFGNVGIAFKGNGFYKNDSRGKATASSGGDKAGSDTSSGTADKGSDSGAKTDSSSSSSSGNGSGSSAPATPATTGKTDKAATTT